MGEKRKWVIQSRPARIRDSHLWTCLSIPPTTGPSIVPGLRGMERCPRPHRLATESPWRELLLQRLPPGARQTGPALSPR